MAIKDFTMGAATPTLLFDPFLTLEIVAFIWLAVGLFYATVGLLSMPSLRHGKPMSAIIVAWCVVVVTAPAVLIWRAVRPRDK